MKTPDNGSLFILHEALKLTKRNFKRKRTDKRRKEDENVRSEAHTAIHNFPPSCFKQPVNTRL